MYNICWFSFNDNVQEGQKLMEKRQINRRDWEERERGGQVPKIGRVPGGCCGLGPVQLEPVVLRRNASRPRAAYGRP